MCHTTDLTFDVMVYSETFIRKITSISFMKSKEIL